MAQSLEETNRTISVSGEGLVRVEPDQAVVRFGVATRDEDPEEARRRNAEAARDALNAVRALGIDERKIRLETLQLQPVREYNPETRRSEDKGYEALRELVVELDDLEKLPEVVARVVQRGANRLNGVSYDLADRSSIRNQALQEAVVNAREKAQLMATALGSSIGTVLRIQEQSFDFPRPMPQFRMEAAVMNKADAAPEPEAYAAGEIEVRSTVQVVFALE